MKKKLTFLLFGLLLAVGWTNGVQAQRLPAESLAKRLVLPAYVPSTGWDNVGPCYQNHNHSSVLVQKPATNPKANPKANNKFQIKELTDSKVIKESRPVSKTNAPLRAGVDLDMKSISYDDAYAITYTWNCGGRDSTSHATDVAKDPEQMYELLREVYTNPKFPGPYYSAFTKNDVRERKVYYGAIEGGWNITGDVLPSTSTTETFTTFGDVTIADGTSTSSGYSYMPIWGYNYDYAQKNQMIYTASQLGLQAGTKITSITFYPRNGITFSGGNVKLSIGNTTTNTFSSTSLITAGDLTQVAETGSITANSSQTEWTITFDHPFTYTGNNLLVQLETTAGTYGRNSSFYGIQVSSGYQSIYSYGSNNPSRTQFLPKAKFDIERTVSYDPYNTIGDIKITASSNDVFFRSITVYDENNHVLTSWDNSETPYSMQIGGSTYIYYNLPMWDLEGVGYLLQYNYQDTYYYGYLTSGSDPGTFYIPYFLTAGHNRVRLVINALNADGSPTITVNDGTPVTVNASSLSGASYEWTINAKSYAHTEYDPDYYLPEQEGYTALVVAVKNEAQPYNDNYVEEFGNGYFETKAEIINYLATHVDSIKLLTDGMRVGDASDYSIGTLFNSEGTFNKFFYIGKGQARQKADILRHREIYNQHLHGEQIPFRFMFEQFSPTSGAIGSETENFYSKMMEGNVYNVIHDCRSVMQFNHQFSMSGNAGTTPYAMTGMNFFIPDYRLKYWEEEDEGYYFDGRIANVYQIVSDDGNPAFNPSLIFQNPSNAAAWYSNYNQQYPPKVGIYKITLDATATQVAQDYTPGNQNYAVTLTWVSSLNEMTGHEVPQTYTLYFWDPVTGERKFLVVEGVTTVNGETSVTTLTYYVEQFATSYVLDYIVYGSPDDTEHQQFVAVSNIDGVVIPGWDDFVGLQLDHHESDFEAGDMANYYRNFLAVVNEDIYNGLTVSQVTGYNGVPQMNTFNLYRWAIKDGVAQGEEKVAVLEFDKANANKVHYNIYYKDENHSDLTEQDILQTPKYSRSAMGLQDEGWIRVKDNGDLVIWPNGYHVNFKTITVKENGNVVTSWNAETMNTLPSGWIVSPGSKWEEFTTSATSDKVGYMEGGGYIAIPDMLNNHSSLTVEIEAYGDGAAVTRIAVNDDSKLIANAAGTTYTWTVNAPTTGSKAPLRATVTESVTVHENGTATNEYLPLLGYYYDYRQQWTQMIYTADQLGDLAAGDVIKSITFYPTTSTLILSGGEIHVYMASTTQSNFDAAFEPVSVDYNNTLVASFTPAANTDCSNGWTITFDTPFTYDGGNIVIDIDTSIGDTYTDEGEGFYGANTSSYMGLFLYYETSGTETGWTGGRFNFQPKATFTYETEGGETPPDPTDPTTLEPTDAGLLRLHLLMVDQFKEEIPDDNKHPEAYGYVLRYEPEQGESKQSGKPDVRIEKTKAKVNGYYTKSEIDADTDAGLTLNVLTADVEMDLDNENPDILYFEMKGKKDAAPASSDPYLTKLQYMKNIGIYEEMEETSPNKGRHYDPEETHHYFDDSTPIVTGNYGINFMTYAPMVSTWGIDRRYFEDDGLDNTYGAPIWKNSVGKAEVKSVTLEKQVANDGSALSSVSWLDGNDQPCSLYILDNIMADGYLPSSDVTNIEYVPYMFRIYVESPTGMLRGFIPPVPGTTTNPGTNAQNDPSFNNFNGPWCVYEENVEDAQVVDLEGGKGVVWQKMKDDSDWANNAVFGALSSMIQGTQNSATFNPDDLTVYVRFYYMVKDSNAKNRAGEARPGNGSQSPGFEPSPWTAVGEIKYVGDVVSVTYVNPLGMTSDRPFNGINIVLTRYNNGTTSTSKVMY